MSEFEFPTNIRQIGNIGEGMRIYMEDYVCTYLQQYAETAGYDERLALLIGRTLVIDGQRVLFISGAVQGVQTVQEKGILAFTDESFDYAQEQIERYFYGLEIVGFMQSQPSYGTMLNSGYASYHLRTFPNPEQVLFVLDPIEKLTTFFTYNDAEDGLEEAKGYFVYYDKNRGMHEYMMNNKIVKLKVQPRIAEEVRTRFTEPVVKPPVRKPHPSGTVHIEQKKMINMLVSLSAVLVLVCFIMGAGLIQSDGRISQLEAGFTQLGTSYKSLVAQVTDGKTASVFAYNEPEQANAAGDAVISKDGQVVLDSLNVVKPLATPVTEAASTPTPTASPSPTPLAVVTLLPIETAMPTPAPIVKYPNVPDTYMVEQGDTLDYISQKFYGDIGMSARIMEVNGIDDPDTLFYGKVIELPKY